MNRESPFLANEIGRGRDGCRQADVDRLVSSSPYAQLVLRSEATEAYDPEAQPLEPQPFERARESAQDIESELSQESRELIRSLDRSALELLPDAAKRRRYLEEIDWRQIEFPKNGAGTPAIKAHWQLADELFSAMATVVPERRVHSFLKYVGPPPVVVVPRTPGRTFKLYLEARDAFVLMRSAAEADGIPLVLGSAYRDEQRQAQIRAKQSNPNAVAQGTSPHTFGVAVDLHLSVPGLTVTEAGASTREKMANVVRMYRSPVYKWMALRAREFGWYPYRREPWHWEYNPPGFATRYAARSSATATVQAGPPPGPTPVLPGPVDAEAVRFAQRVLNALQGEHLSDDGKLGPMTRAALSRFRNVVGLSPGSVLDPAVDIALIQRVLEELSQQSLFGHIGMRDAKTDMALAAFKSERGLPSDSVVDTRTRLALTDALARRTSSKEFEDIEPDDETRRVGATREQIGFAQRVLSLTQGENLSDDGIAGKQTLAAFQRFRAANQLGGASAYDESLEIALVQRALNALGQATSFTQIGMRDTQTESAIAAFKVAQGMSGDATIDASTRRALTDALARVPRAHLAGQLWTFVSKTLGLHVAAFCSQAALESPGVEVLLYAHGLLSCAGPKRYPEGFITDAPFSLGRVVADAGRPVVLVVPFLDWEHHAGGRAFSKGHPRWHALAKPHLLNAMLDEVLAEVGRIRNAPAPTLDELIISGHSRAYDFLEPLASSHGDAEMRRGALAKLSSVWAFDTTYTGDVDKWLAWLKLDPQLRVDMFYIDDSRTSKVGKQFRDNRSARLAVTTVKESHCQVPGTRMRSLLRARPVVAPEVTDATEYDFSYNNDEAGEAGDQEEPCCMDELDHQPEQLVADTAADTV